MATSVNTLATAWKACNTSSRKFWGVGRFCTVVAEEFEGRKEATHTGYLLGTYAAV